MSASSRTEVIKKSAVKALALLLAMGALLTCFSRIARAEDGNAENITTLLSWEKPLTEVYVGRLADSDVTTMTRVDKGKTLCGRWTDDIEVQGFWLQWDVHPERYTVEELSGETVLRAYCVVEKYNSRFLTLRSDTRGVRITVEGADAIYCTFQAYGAGTLPDFIHDWEPAADKADLLLIVAHPDDEQIFLGGIVPYYVGEKGLSASVMLMTCSDRFREDEALNGLWTVGMRTYPVFAGFRDVRCDNKERILKAWNEKKACKAIVEEIRRCKPEVVITHDVWGEYGHGAHRACAYLTKRAVQFAADPAVFPESAEKYGAWQVQKLYFHAWREDQGYLNCVTMNWDAPLSAFDGRTAREMAALGYACHASQSDNWADNMEENRFDCAIYSLVCSEVGADENCNDLLEHIDPARLTRSDYTPPAA